MAKMLPILHKTPRNQSINQSINRITIWLMKKIFCLLIIEIPKKLDKKRKKKHNLTTRLPNGMHPKYLLQTSFFLQLHTFSQLYP